MEEAKTVVVSLTELEALRRNDERYRWLRNGNAYAPEEWGITGGLKLDEWIDDELKKK